MTDTDNITARPTSLTVMPTIYPVSPPIEEMLETFWETGPEFDSVAIDIASPVDSTSKSESTPQPSVLERLGSSPFERGGFPVIGFLATTYDNVRRYVVDRSRE